MRTPKRVLTAISKYDRKITRTLQLTRTGGRIRGNTQYMTVGDFAAFRKIARLLKKNKIKSAVNIYDNHFIVGLPIMVVDYLDRQLERFVVEV